MGIGIHCNIRVVGTDWCSTLFRLVTSVFVFSFQVGLFRMASLVRASLEFNTR